MNNESLGALLNTSAATSSDAFEIISVKCNDNTSYEDQKKAMSALSTIVQQFEGFKSQGLLLQRRKPTLG